MFKELEAGKILPEEYDEIVNYHNAVNPAGEIAASVNFENETVRPDWIYQIVDSMAILDSTALEVYRKKHGLPPLTGKRSPIQGTWYSEYPFETIKKAAEEYGKINLIMDYFEITRDILRKAEKSFKKRSKKELTVFSLRSEVEIKSVILEDVKKYFNIPDDQRVKDKSAPSYFIKK